MYVNYDLGSNPVGHLVRDVLYHIIIIWVFVGLLFLGFGEQ